MIQSKKREGETVKDFESQDQFIEQLKIHTAGVSEREIKIEKVDQYG